MSLDNKYFARKILYDKVNHILTIIYIDALCTIYAVKYYENHVERQKYEMLRRTVEANFIAGNQPNHALIIDMLDKFAAPFKHMINEKIGYYPEFVNEYSITDLCNSISYFNRVSGISISTDISISTTINNAYLLDFTLMQFYDVFYKHAQLSANSEVQLTKELESAKRKRDEYRRLFDAEMTEHRKALDQNKAQRDKLAEVERDLYEVNYDNKFIKEKLLKSENAYIYLRNTNIAQQSIDLELNTNIQNLTAENKHLRATVSHLQTHMIAAINTLDAYQPSSDKK